MPGEKNIKECPNESCKKKFESQESLVKHCTQRHGSWEFKIIEGKIHPIPLKCPYCSYESTEFTLFGHITGNHHDICFFEEIYDVDLMEEMKLQQ